MQRLLDKVIVVAGAGGNGSELARRYASEGAKVVLGDFAFAAAQTVAEEIKAAGGVATAVELDGSDEESINAAVELACSAYGGLDGMHVNFASFADGLFDAGVDLPLEAYDEVMRVNARGSLLCSRAAVPALIARGGGAIIYTSSGSAHDPLPVRVAYAMSKAASHALMRTVATRHGPDNIRANVIAPGIIMHPKLEAVTDENFKQWAFGMMPTKSRLGKPTDIAAIAAMLMSEEGSYITGQVLCVDGGATMRP